MNFPKWLPDELKHWFEHSNQPGFAVQRRLATHLEMREVWKWFSDTRSERISKLSCNAASEIDDPEVSPQLEPRFKESLNPLGFLSMLAMAAHRPRKPADMPPKSRRRYLDDIKKHARSLQDLLEDTEFDLHLFDVGADAIEKDDVEAEVLEEIHSIICWSRSEEEGLIAAFETDDKGNLYQHGSHYPLSSLKYLLEQLHEWASQDDYFDGINSVKAIRHGGVKGLKTSYLARLDHNFKRIGFALPVVHYAAAVNVALDLTVKERLDEDATRKLLSRIRQRISGREEGRGSEPKT